MTKFVLPLIAAAFLGGCTDGAGPESSSSSVSIKFGIAGSTASSSSAAMFSVAGGLEHPGHIVGSNGVLDITAIFLIIDEFELEPVEHDCDDGLGGDEHCPKFEQEFFFIDVPLDGNFTDVVTDEIPVGIYDELEIEVDDVELDDDDEEDADLISKVLADIEAAGFGAGGLFGVVWPDEASMAVIGTFTPTGEGPVSFTTFFEAEIEIEVEFDEPLEVTVAVPNPDIFVMLMLDMWFKSGGEVLNLAELQDELVEFELEIEDGFEVKIGIDD